MIVQPALRFLQTLTGTALIVLASTSVQAANWTVNKDFDPGGACPANCTLRNAIQEAGDGDTILFDGDMTIHLESEIEITKNITIDGGGYTVIIDGDNINGLFDNIFKITNGAVTLDGLIIQNGPIDEYAIYAVGNNTEITARNSTVRNSKKIAFYIGMGAKFTLEDGFILNSSRQGIYTDGDSSHVTIINSVISGNGLTGHETIRYPGINLRADASADIISSTITGNGVGISLYTASNPGTQATVAINNSTISDNFKDGIELDGDTVTNAYYSTIANNGEYGVNTKLDSKSLFQHVTFAGNESGGIHVPSGDIDLKLINSLVADGCEIGEEAGIDDQGGNIEAGNTCYFSEDSSISGAGLAALNLGPLQDNGGLTHTILPGAEGPGVDHVACIGGHEHDQRGIELPQGERCDVGAVEVQVSDHSGSEEGAGGEEGPAQPAQVTPVPTLSQWGLMLLAGLLGWMGMRRVRPQA